MSLIRFHGETGKAMTHGPASTVNERRLSAQEQVRDRWLADGELRALVSAVLGNWTSGNCVPFMRPLAVRLLQDHEDGLYNLLWLRTIKRQVDAFFRYYSPAKEKGDTFEQVRAVDHSRFDPRNYDHYHDSRTAAAYLLSELVKALAEWKQQLGAHGRSMEVAISIEQSIEKLKRPKIVVPRSA